MYVPFMLWHLQVVCGGAERITNTRTLLLRYLGDPTSLCMHRVEVYFGGHVLLQVV